MVQRRRIWWLVVVGFVSIDRASANQLLDFDPFQQFKNSPGHTDDLIVVLHPAKSFGRTPLFNGVKDFATSGMNERKRGLKVSHCRQCKHFGQLLSRWHIKEDALPVAVLFPHCMEHPDEGKFHLDLRSLYSAADIQVTLKGFVERYDAGKEHFHVLSQPVPTAEEQEGEPVLEVVGDSFQGEVLDKLAAKNISSLVLFYKPWCGWCRQVQPVFKQIGVQVGRGNPLLQVAKMDVDMNELVPHVHAETGSVPQIYLFTPGNTANPLAYRNHNSRTVDAILSWSKEHVPGLKAWIAGDRSASVSEAGAVDGEEVAEL